MFCGYPRERASWVGGVLGKSKNCLSGLRSRCGLGSTSSGQTRPPRRNGSFGWGFSDAVFRRRVIGRARPDLV